MMEWKAEIQRACQRWLSERRNHVEEALFQARQGIVAEEKSSAGDKYETGRAMGHLEQERLSGQLKELIQMESLLNSLSLQGAESKIAPGSLFQAENQWVFLAIGIGRLRVGEKDVFVVSASSPMGKVCLGKSVGDTVLLNGRSLAIVSIG